jgi:hypothetical protein
MQHVDSEGDELNDMPPPPSLMQRDDTGGYEETGAATDTPAGIMPPPPPFTVRPAPRRRAPYTPGVMELDACMCSCGAPRQVACFWRIVTLLA